MELNKIYNEDCLTGLKKLKSNSIDCCVTSPPYFGLRDYGTATWDGGDPGCSHTYKINFPYNENFNERSGNAVGKKKQESQRHEKMYKEICEGCGAVRIDSQIGLEQTPEIYLEKIVQVFEEIRRVLKVEGTLWLNLGDTYCSTAPGTRNAPSVQIHAGDASEARANMRIKTPSGMKPKDLMGIPWMVAFALRSAGWYLRQDIIWHKKNPMPESVTDRCTKSHEYVFLLSKSSQYYYDHQAILEEANYDGRKDTIMKGSEKYRDGFAPTTDNPQTFSMVGHERWKNKINGDIPARNKRSVWSVNVQGYAEAHFATFPEELIVDMIKAGSSEHGCCKWCGIPYTRILEPSERYAKVLGESYHDHSEDLSKGMMQSRGVNKQNKMRDAGIPGAEYETKGWQKNCKCETTEIVPAIIVDPFMGAGTTALVARKLNRNFIGFELNTGYIDISNKRLYSELGMFL